MVIVRRELRLSIAVVGLLLCSLNSSAQEWRVAHWNVLHGWGRYWNQPGQDGVLWPPSGPFSAISDDGSGPDGDTYGTPTGEPSGGCGTAPYLATWKLGTNGPLQTFLRGPNLGADPSLVAMTLSEGLFCISGAEVKAALAAGDSAWSTTGTVAQYDRDVVIAKYGWASPQPPVMTAWDPVTNPNSDMVQIYCRDTKYQAVHGYIYTDAARTPSKAVHLFATRLKGDHVCETQKLDQFVRAKAGTTGRILIMGDFNFQKGSTPYNDLTGRNYVEAGTSSLLPPGDKDALTCCFGTSSGGDGHGFGSRIDMGFHDNLPSATSYWVGNKTVGPTDEVAMSDHAVIRIGFTESTGGSQPPPPPWQTTDVGTGVNGSTAFANGTFTMTAGGSDLWSTADDFHFVHQQLTGDGEIVANVQGFQHPSGAAFSLGAVMMRASLASNSAHASMMITNTGKAKFRRRLTTGAETLSTGPSEGSTPFPRYLKLNRAGNVFSAFISSDGTTWTEVAGSPETIALPSTVQVGLVALRNGSTAPTTVTMNNVTVQATPPPSTWQSADVGNVGPAGSQTQTGADSFTITAGGDDVWAGADAFRFVYQPMTGDGEISAFISDLTLPSGAAFSLGGVMIRADLSASAMHATMMTTTQNKAKYRRRITTGATTTLSDGPSEGTQPFRTWVKVKRVGNTFTAYLSNDGITWNQTGPSQTIAMPANTLVGLVALRNGTAAGTMTGTFTNIVVVP